jgi:heme/copper-type cytochrome/quinol oxidase subunit 3
MRWFQIAMGVTALLGAAFLALEAYEFLHLIGEGLDRGAAPSCRRSSRWSAVTDCT